MLNTHIELDDKTVGYGWASDGDLDLTFRIGKDYLERHFFEQWSRIMLGGTKKESRNNYAYYDVSWFYSIIGDINKGSINLPDTEFSISID